MGTDGEPFRLSSFPKLDTPYWSAFLVKALREGRPEVQMAITIYLMYVCLHPTVNRDNPARREKELLAMFDKIIIALHRDEVLAVRTLPAGQTAFDRYSWAFTSQELADIKARP